MPFPPHPRQQPPLHPYIPKPQPWPWFQQQPLMPLQFLGSPGHTMPWSGSRAPAQHYQGSPCGISPAYQGMPQQYQYRPASSGPHCGRHRKGHQKTTEAQCNSQLGHVLSGTITRDHPTGIHLGMARMPSKTHEVAGHGDPLQGTQQ